MTTLHSATPALPVRDVPTAVAFYREKLGFAVAHQDGGYAIVRRDGVEITLWEANSPGTPGAEPRRTRPRRAGRAATARPRT